MSEQLGVKEYWLFDPKGEWIEQQLRGYRLRGEIYEPIQDGCSEPLQLRLVVEGSLIGFYREDTGEKLLIPDELVEALRQEILARQQAEELVEQERQRAQQQHQRAQQAQLQIEQLKARLRSLNLDLDTIE